MNKRTNLVAIALTGTTVLIGMPACGVNAESTGSEGADNGGIEDPAIASWNFVVALDRETTEENVTPQILEAGEAEIRAACADYPAASIRVHNPISAQAYIDLQCASLVDGNAAHESISALSVAGENNETVAQSQERLSPFSLGCGVFVLASTLITNRAICPRARNPRDAGRCTNWSDVGWGGLTLMCAVF